MLNEFLHLILKLALCNEHFINQLKRQCNNTELPDSRYLNKEHKTIIQRSFTIRIITKKKLLIKCAIFKTK